MERAFTCCSVSPVPIAVIDTLALGDDDTAADLVRNWRDRVVPVGRARCHGLVRKRKQALLDGLVGVGQETVVFKGVLLVPIPCAQRMQGTA